MITAKELNEMQTICEYMTDSPEKMQVLFIKGIPQVSFGEYWAYYIRVTYDKTTRRAETAAEKSKVYWNGNGANTEVYFYSDGEKVNLKELLGNKRVIKVSA